MKYSYFQVAAYGLGLQLCHTRLKPLRSTCCYGTGNLNDHQVRTKLLPVHLKLYLTEVFLLFLKEFRCHNFPAALPQ